MADQKVSDLPSLNGSAVDPADLLYIVDSSAGTAGSKKITIGQFQLAPYSAGTINGITYFDGSKVLSSGSGLTFDASTGKLEAAGVIVGTSSAANTRALRATAIAGHPSNLSFLRSAYAEWFIGSTNNSTSLNITPTDETHAAPSMTFALNGRIGMGGAPLGTARLTVSNPQGDVQIRADDGNVTTYVAYSSGSGATAVNYYGTATNHDQAFITNNIERVRFTKAGDFITNVNAAAPTLGTNSTMSFELTSNTSLKIVVRGTDGVTRSATLTLS